MTRVATILAVLSCAVWVVSGCQVRVGDPPARGSLGAACGSAAECPSGARCLGGLCSYPAPCTVTAKWTQGGAEQTEITRHSFGAHNRSTGFVRTLPDGKTLVHEDTWAFDGKAVITKVVIDGVQQEMIRSDRDDVGRIQWESPIFKADEVKIPRTEWKWGPVMCQVPVEVIHKLAGEVAWRETAECDDNGRATVRRIHRGADELLHEERLAYDAQGRLTEGARYSEDGQLLERTHKAFRSGELVDETVTYDYGCWAVEGSVISPVTPGR